MYICCTSWQIRILLIISPMLLPRCWLTYFPSPMGFPFKIVSNSRRWPISLNIVIMWRDIAIYNAKVTSSFKCGLSLVSFNVKLAWSSSWKLLMVNLHLISSPIMLYQSYSKFRPYSNCWFLGYTTPETFDKTNIVYWSLASTTIHMPSKSWICHIVIRHIDSPM
jgi:hypothetical protein